MIYQHLENLIQQATQTGLIEKTDQIYARNQIMHLLHVTGDMGTGSLSHDDEAIPDILDYLIDYAIQHHVIEDVFDEKEILAANIMNCLVARPSTINTVFQEKYEESPIKATDYFYQLSKNSNYIQMKRINKNIHFTADTEYGELDITINLSKPEKDPEQIKRERENKQNIDYPKCVLCVENEGYAGRTGYPARANHRVIRIPLQGENWFLQYSPYVYYNEHSIVLAEEHRDMKINKKTFAQLLAFIDQFPHYFIGSNADLPVVGGSILTHDHYQGGRYKFAMTDAKEAFSFTFADFDNVSARVLHWPLSVIRLKSLQKDQLLDAADHILQTWKNYSDESAEVKAFSGSTPHNTITPIARMRDGAYELDLVLRNNRTSDEHPLGIFHPHADVHHIKKENIGLIEVMGLAVLPARLKDELAEINAFLAEQPNNIADYHKSWAEAIKQKHGTITDKTEAEHILQKELGIKFSKVLEDAGVFKDESAFERFIKTL